MGTFVFVWHQAGRASGSMGPPTLDSQTVKLNPQPITGSKNKPFSSGRQEPRNLPYGSLQLRLICLWTKGTPSLQ